MLTQAYYGTAENNHSRNNGIQFERLIYITQTCYQSNHHCDTYHCNVLNFVSPRMIHKYILPN